MRDDDSTAPANGGRQPRPALADRAAVLSHPKLALGAGSRARLEAPGGIRKANIEAVAVRVVFPVPPMVRALAAWPELCRRHGIQEVSLPGGLTIGRANWNWELLGWLVQEPAITEVREEPTLTAFGGNGA